MLCMPEITIDMRERSPLALAFLGDAVLELLVRSHLLAQSRLPAAKLHKNAIKMVSAKSQFAALPILRPMLTAKEEDIFRRGRNTNKGTTAKNAEIEEYRASTGIEAVFGWLYLRGDEERISQLFAPIWQRYIENN